jgi:dTDP-4-amino-4,6-dideoxygalactose transaminase
MTPIREALDAAAARVIGSGHFVLGTNVAAFEQAFAAYCGVGHCIGVANGTDALELALKGLGIAPGDYVGVVANAAMYATSAVLACGAQPVFIDVGPELLLMDPHALETVLASGQRLDAIVITHLYGRLAPITELLNLCRAHDVLVVEDCAQAHGAALADGRRAGSFGDAASFSFYPTKNLGALGDGGAVVTRDPNIADRVRQLRQYGWTSKYTSALAGGRNSRLDEMQASFLLVMLPMLDAWNRRRREIANRYSRHITNANIHVPPVSESNYVAHLYVVQTGERERLRAHLSASSVQTEVHYPLPDHRQPCFEGRHASVTLPNTEYAAGRVLTLPCFPEMTDDEVKQVIDACNQF